MAELLDKGKAESIWLLNKSKYPGIKDLHVHANDGKITITMVSDSDHKDHLTLGENTLATDFDGHVDYMYKKFKQFGWV